MEYPTLSICLNLVEALDTNKYGVYGNYIDKRVAYKKLLRSLTASEILSNTFSNETILRDKGACAIRKKLRLMFYSKDMQSWLSKEDCFKYITISKFINRYLMCYRIEMKELEILDYFEVSYSPSYPGVIQMYYLNPDIFLNVSMYTVFVHMSKTSNLFDSIFSVASTINFTSLPAIKVLFIPISIDRLPLPYATDCKSVKGYRSIFEYYLDRLNNVTMSELNHVQTLGHVYGHYPYPIITPSKLLNETFQDKFMELKNRVMPDNPDNCHIEYNIPRSFTEPGNQMKVSIIWPQDNRTKLFHVGNQDTIDYLVYILSSIGIWLGLSIFSILTPVEKAFFSYCLRKFKKFQNTGKSEDSGGQSNCYFIIRDCDTVLRSKVEMMNRRMRRNEQSICRLIQMVNRK